MWGFSAVRFRNLKAQYSAKICDFDPEKGGTGLRLDLVRTTALGEVFTEISNFPCHLYRHNFLTIIMRIINCNNMVSWYSVIKPSNIKSIFWWMYKFKASYVKNKTTLTNLWSQFLDGQMDEVLASSNIGVVVLNPAECMNVWLQVWELWQANSFWKQTYGTHKDSIRPN
jgi:hypothetical protein